MHLSSISLNNQYELHYELHFEIFLIAHKIFNLSFLHLYYFKLYNANQGKVHCITFLHIRIKQSNKYENKNKNNNEYPTKIYMQLMQETNSFVTETKTMLMHYNTNMY